MNALRERIQQKGIFFSISDMKYKSKYGYYKLNNGSEFPFFFEIAVVHSNNILHNLDVIESLNSSAMPGSYSFISEPTMTRFIGKSKVIKEAITVLIHHVRSSTY